MEQVMNYLYLNHSCRKQVMSHILSRGGAREDAEDVFQDGIRQLILNVRANKFEGKGSITGYLFGMCKYLWLNRFQKIRRESPTDQEVSEKVSLAVDPESIMIGDEQERKVAELLDRLGDKCSQVLALWKLSYSMQEIADEMGYKSEGFARKKKHLCFQALLKLLEKEPGWKSLIS